MSPEILPIESQQRLEMRRQPDFIELVRQRLEVSRLVAHHVSRNLSHRKSAEEARSRLMSLSQDEDSGTLSEAARLFKLKANVALAETQFRASGRDLSSCRDELRELDRLIDRHNEV